jgi:acetyl-CoA C-acetyltransferase
MRGGWVRVALVVGVEKMSGERARRHRCLGRAACQNEKAGVSCRNVRSFAEAYAQRYRIPTEAMAWIAVKNHSDAMDNPLAQMRQPIDLEFCPHPSGCNLMIALAPQ